MLIQRLINRTQLAPGLVGALLLLQLALVRALASATSERVYVFGHELHWKCWFQQKFNFPCPTCGLTRSVILWLHGDAGAAWELNPAGLLLVSGLLLLGLALILLTLYRQRHAPHAAGILHRRIRIATKIYAHLLVAVLFAHWLVDLASR